MTTSLKEHRPQSNCDIIQNDIQGCKTCFSLAAGRRENGERIKKWRGNGERIRKWRKIYSLYFLIYSLYPPSLSISYIKNCHILSQNVKYGTFVANVTKNLTYALWGNNSGSNSLRGSSASCAGLSNHILFFCKMIDTGWSLKMFPSIFKTPIKTGNS